MTCSWHSVGVRHSRYGFRVVYDASSSINTPVSGVLQERDWIWKPVRLEALVSIQSKLPLIKKRRTRPFGFPSNQENSLVQRHWTKLDPSDQKSIWFSIVVPRYAFICWLADRSRLVVQDRLLQWWWYGLCFLQELLPTSRAETVDWEENSCSIQASSECNHVLHLASKKCKNSVTKLKQRMVFHTIRLEVSARGE